MDSGLAICVLVVILALVFVVIPGVQAQKRVKLMFEKWKKEAELKDDEK